METKHPVSSSGQETVEASNAFRFDAPKAGGRELIRGVALFARAVDRPIISSSEDWIPRLGPPHARVRFILCRYLGDHQPHYFGTGLLYVKCEINHPVGRSPWSRTQNYAERCTADGHISVSLAGSRRGESAPPARY